MACGSPEPSAGASDKDASTGRGDGAVSLDGSTEDGGTPAGCAARGPTRTDFGQVYPGSASQTVRVVSACRLEDARIEGPFFTLDAVERDGDGYALTVGFAPGVGRRVTGELTLRFDDGQAWSLALRGGLPVEPGLVVTPEALDFGRHLGGGCRERTLEPTLFNYSVETARILEAELSPESEAAFSIDSEEVVGLELSRESTATFPVEFSAQRPGAYRGRLDLAVEVRGQVQRFTIPLRGERAPPLIVDRFTQRRRPVLDLLFVVDDTTSISDEAPRLDTFGAELDAAYLDYRVVVTFVTDGPDESRLSAADFEGVLEDLVIVGGHLQSWVHSISAPWPPGGCTSSEGATARSGEKLAKLAVSTVSICQSNWLDLVTTDLPRPRRSFLLSTVPEEPSLEVEVAGRMVPRFDPSGRERWSYSLSGGIYFSEEDIPASGAEVRVSYLQRCW